MPGADSVIRSKLNIVDLAGSERVSRTSSMGQTLKEAKYINSNLFFLEMVIVALHEKDTWGNSNNVHGKVICVCGFPMNTSLLMLTLLCLC